ncbi:ABC transporter substrate-binding protein [Alkalispirochaeta alkalica]|uniref:ABC transporter substrate-binding protein n=1 Tax=Alkalispirochaeta alkalica TaxID=46356 RepID=UPI0003A27E7B|nr:ABC transporter substrate-binding protein [Alkalispirochaeta alkalica]
MRTKARLVTTAIMAALAATVIIAGCQAREDEADQLVTLRVAVSNFPNSLDASIAAERNAQNVAWQMFDSLVWANDDNIIEPALAESWEVSEDGTEYIFHLREGVTFHNGEPFNAQAVVYSWERGKRPVMEWSDRWARAEVVEALDEYTLRITTEEPDPLFLSVMAQHWNIVPPLYTEEAGDDAFGEAPVGTGPFQFVEWVREDRIVLERNPDYWRMGLPKADRVIYRPIPEASTRMAAIQTGQVDIVSRLTHEQAEALESVSGVTVVTYPIDRVFYIAFNNLTSGVGEPTEDARVRRAMNYAVDRQAIIDSLFGGRARLATGLMTESNLGYNHSIEPYPYDPDKARQLLAEAGYPEGFSIGFAAPSGAYTNFEQVAEAVQGYLADVGIRADLDIMESGRFWDLEGEKQLPPLFGDSWSERSGESLPRLRGALDGWDASFSAWSDPEIDRYLDLISVTIDQNERAQLYKDLHSYMYQDPPFIYLYVPETFEATRDNVVDYRPRAAEDYFLMFTTLR